MTKKKTFLRRLLPIEIESLYESSVQAIKDFGIINFIKIVFFVTFRALKYKVKLAQLPREAIIQKKIMGNEMLLHRFDGGLSWDLLVNGIREENSTHFLRKELRPGMQILEVGANIGYYLLQEAGIIGDEGYIHAFEPDPSNHELLEKNIALNDVTNVKLHKMALGNKNQEIDFFIAERGNLSSFVIKTDTVVPVAMGRGDDILGEQKIDYVRMDVEGYELDILKGIEKTLERSVQGLFIEVHPEYLKRLGSSMEELFEWLDERGFYLAQTYCDYDWSNASFTNQKDLIEYKYAQKMIWRSFFRKRYDK